MLIHDNAVILENGSTKDLAYTYQGEPIVVMDYARTQIERINYSFLELLKEGRLFSGKYQSTNKYFKPPKVVCFANFKPNVDSMSHDRWHIFQITMEKDKYKLKLEPV